MERNYSIQAFFGALVAALSSVFGGWTNGIKWLLFFMLFDYMTGLMAGYIRGELNSGKGWRGIFKKLMYLVFVSMAFGISEMTGQIAIRDGVIAFLCGNEMLSITENAAKMGIPIPQQLLQGIEIWKKCTMQKGDCKDEDSNKTDKQE